MSKNKNSDVQIDILPGSLIPSPEKLRENLRKQLLVSVPIVTLRNFVPFIDQLFPLKPMTERSLKALEAAHEKQSPLVCLTQISPDIENPKTKDLYEVGLACRVANIMELPDGSHTALILAYGRVKLLRLTGSSPYLRGKFLPTPSFTYLNKVKSRQAFQRFEEMASRVFEQMEENEAEEFRKMMNANSDPIYKIGFLLMQLPGFVREKQLMLESHNFVEYADKATSILESSLQMNEVRKEFQARAQQELSQGQRQMFLETQIRMMQEELGIGDDDDIAALSKRAAEMNWPADVHDRFEKELRKLERFNPQSPDYAVQYSYIDTLLSLPWDNCSNKDFKLKQVQEILDRDHYGLRDVKDRIVEQMAVIRMRGDVKAGILCLYGPPGVGKTSLGKSVAEALGREYVRVSFGGLHDESEIRGHRKTYLGAMPGRIISGLQKCNTSNPVFVLDEIDKIGQDIKGDPSTALLEVLDPEQNSRFHDNYIDVDYDLSRVLFIATANTLQTISTPLLDRMELIEISGYIPAEKIEIALRHLVGAKLEENGLAKDEITFTREAIALIIDEYTRESGVRQLEKKISKVIRKIVRLKVGEEDYPTTVGPEEVRRFLGKQEVFPDTYENNDYVGVVTGLAWTASGGDILFIESSLIPGKGEKLTLTGNLGDIMKESATIALQYLKANAAKFGIPSEKFSQYDVHIHVPEGAIPKDGPSAGITMVTSLASAFKGVKVRERLAMTGEMTLRGKVLPVGGIKEKILAAKRAGITDIILCEKNRKDIEDIDAMYLEGLNFHYVMDIEQVLDIALLKE